MHFSAGGEMTEKISKFYIVESYTCIEPVNGGIMNLMTVKLCHCLFSFTLYTLELRPTWSGFASAEHLWKH